MVTLLMFFKLKNEIHAEEHGRTGHTRTYKFVLRIAFGELFSASGIARYNGNSARAVIEREQRGSNRGSIGGA